MKYSLKLRILVLTISTILASPAISQNIESIDSDVEVAYTAKDLACLAQNIFHEAGSESFEGKVAVAQVSLNRAEDVRYPNNVCAVISQKTSYQGVTVCQFSWYCTAKRNIVPKASEMYKESLLVAKLVLEGLRIPKLTNALYFHATHTNPQWRKVKVAQIGNHIFYRDKKSN